MVLFFMFLKFPMSFKNTVKFPNLNEITVILLNEVFLLVHNLR